MTCIRFLCAAKLALIILVFLSLVPIYTFALTNIEGKNLPIETAWQQRVDYDIQANVDAIQMSLDAVATIIYYNHSPDALNELILELPQQRFRQLKIKANGRLAGTEHIAFFSMGEAELPDKPLETVQSGSFYRVQLLKPLMPNEQVKLAAKWDLQFIPRDSEVSPRAGYEMIGTDNTSSILSIAQWFPRALGYDAKFGWDTLKFEGRGEFHLEIGQFNVALHASEELLVAASTSVLNPAEVYPSTLVDTLKLLARTPSKELGDSATPEEIPESLDLAEQYYAVYSNFNDVSMPRPDKIWRYQGNNIRDFAFAISNTFSWWRRNIKTVNGDIPINVYVPTLRDANKHAQTAISKESKSSGSTPQKGRYLWWKHGLNATQHAIQYLDRNLAPFAFEEYSVVNITGIGMEYPGLTTVGFRGPDSTRHDAESDYSRTDLFDVIGGTIHEVAHSYFPMLVNTNERREGFLDEGLTSYFSYLIEQSWSADFQSFYGAPSDVEAVMRQRHDAPVTLADQLASKLDSHYHVPATAWHILATQILPPGQLMTLLNQFVIEHQYKRVYFSDLTAFLNAHTSIDLTLFFKQWFSENNRVDIAVRNVTTNSLSSSKTLANSTNLAPQTPIYQSLIDVVNIGGIAMPITLNVIEHSGKINKHIIAYQDWIKADSNTYTLDITTHSPITAVVIDPDHVSADTNRLNNIWYWRP